MLAFKDITRALLSWYAVNARVLPWRVRGIHPNPYHVVLSEMMLQQTTVSTVIPYFHTFTTLWPTIEDLAQATQEEVLAHWAGLGYYARARNLHKAAQVLAQGWPVSLEEWKKIPGFGPYTTAAVASIGFGYPVLPVDGNIRRVLCRLSAKDLTPQDFESFAEQLVPKDQPGDFAQALMDLGAQICTPKNPKCNVCPLAPFCLGRERAEAYPSPKEALPKRTRFGVAFFISTEKGILGVRRSSKGLLGGMLALPSTSWDPQPVEDLGKAWETVFPSFLLPLGLSMSDHIVEHTFTHFHLKLQVCGGSLTEVPADFLLLHSCQGLPTVMKKVWKEGESFFDCR